MVEQGWLWSFDGDGDLFRLVSEALRIHLAHLFDSALAVHTSLVEPLAHQITAVYQAMLPRQPLRFLLADDPGAGKTIMTGLLMKELIARGDLQRCLVVCPGSLAEQWQDELYRRFHLGFEILTNDKLAAARTGNWFLESDLAIARLDKLARDGALQEKLQAPDCRWDLREHRNKWAHQQPFSSDDAYRALDSAHRLLTSISAPQVRELDAFKQELRRRDRRIPRSGGVLPPHLPHRQPAAAPDRRRAAAVGLGWRPGRPAPDQLRRRQDPLDAGARSPVLRRAPVRAGWHRPSAAVDLAQAGERHAVDDRVGVAVLAQGATIRGSTRACGAVAVATGRARASLTGRPPPRSLPRRGRCRPRRGSSTR